MTKLEKARHIANLRMRLDVRQALRVKKVPYVLGLALPVKGKRIA